MNKRAKELGMNDTCFKNCHGIDEDGHLTSSYDTSHHKWGAFPNTLHSKLKINKNSLKISSFEIFTNISTNKYSNILKQTFVIWTSSNDKKTIENIINKFNYIDNPIEVDYINGVIKYDISATNFFSNIV